jgi:putative DNA primase/helicase
MQVLATLPFVAPSDLSVVLSLMLTSLVRRSLPSAPMGAITAPTPASGKR